MNQALLHETAPVLDPALLDKLAQQQQVDQQFADIISHPDNQPMFKPEIFGAPNAEKVAAFRAVGEIGTATTVTNPELRKSMTSAKDKQAASMYDQRLMMDMIALTQKKEDEDDEK